MQESAEVISFPLDGVNKPFLRDFVGSDSERLENISCRLWALSNMISCAKQAGAFEGNPTGAVLSGIEYMIDDCLAIADVRPVLKGN
jgi:hypothetical protein